MTKENECPDCVGRGWYVEEDRHGMQVQVQCESCFGRGELQDAPANIQQQVQADSSTPNSLTKCWNKQEVV